MKLYCVSFPDSGTWVEILGMRLYSLSRSQTLLRLVSEAWETPLLLSLCPPFSVPSSSLLPFPPLSSPLLPSPPCPPSSTPVHPGDQSKPPGIHWPLEQCSTRSCRTGSRPSRGWGGWPGSPSTGGCTIWDAHDHPSYSSRKRSYWEGKHWMWTHTITITLTLSRHHTLPGHSKSPQHTLLQWPHDPPNVEPAAYKFSLQVEPYKSTDDFLGPIIPTHFFFLVCVCSFFPNAYYFPKNSQK